MVTAAPPVASSPKAGMGAKRAPALPSGPIHSALLAGIVLVAAILRLHAISARTFWFDETVSVEIARLPWSQFVLALWNREANMSFYYVLVHYWLLLGSSEGVVRGLSALFSVATIPVIHALGVRLFNRKTALVAAWLLSINAFHVCYGQEARGYALAVFLACVATLLFVRNLQEPAQARWGTYTLVCVLLVYTHFLGGLIVLAHCASLAFLRREDIPWREFFRFLIRFSLLVIPIAVFVAKTGSGPINWIQKTSLRTIYYALTSMSGNGGMPLLALVVIAVLAAACWTFLSWRGTGLGSETWAYLLLWSWLLVPVFLVILASAKWPLFVTRYLIPCLPALVLLAAAGITRIRPAALGWVLCAAISVGSLAGTVSYYRKDFDIGRDDWRGATSYIFGHAQSGDGVFFHLNFGRIPFEYYKSLLRPLPSWPQPLDAADHASLTSSDFQFRNLGDSLQSARPAGDRVWLVLMYDTDPDGKPNRASLMSRAVFGKGRSLVDEKEFSGVTVLLYSRVGSSSGGPDPVRP